ncbi:MAG TPA: hypothetical protein VF077_05705 [Nitrospiraceae bacterium]
MAEVLNTTLKHDGEVVGHPGDKVPAMLKKEPGQAEGESLYDSMVRTNSIVSQDEYDRLNESEETGPVTVSGQGPTPEQAGEEQGDAIADPTVPNLADKDPSKTGDLGDGDGGDDEDDDK